MQFIDIHSHFPSNEVGITTIFNVLDAFDTIPATGYYSAGLHPWHLNSENVTEAFDCLKSTVLQPNLLAIGECGLDKVSSTEWELQIKWFSIQVDLSIQSKKPLIIHCVRAFDEVLSIMADKPITSPVIFHGFNKNKEIARRILDAGYYLSFGKHLVERPIIEVLAMTPTERFFLETDASGLSIAEIYRLATTARRVTPDSLREQIHSNFVAVFGFDPQK